MAGLVPAIHGPDGGGCPEPPGLVPGAGHDGVEDTLPSSWPDSFRPSTGRTAGDARNPPDSFRGPGMTVWRTRSPRHGRTRSGHPWAAPPGMPGTPRSPGMTVGGHAPLVMAGLVPAIHGPGGGGCPEPPGLVPGAGHDGVEDTLPSSWPDSFRPSMGRAAGDARNPPDSFRGPGMTVWRTRSPRHGRTRSGHPWAGRRGMPGTSPGMTRWGSGREVSPLGRNDEGGEPSGAPVEMTGVGRPRLRRSGSPVEMTRVGGPPAALTALRAGGACGAFRAPP